MKRSLAIILALLMALGASAAVSADDTDGTALPESVPAMSSGEITDDADAEEKTAVLLTSEETTEEAADIIGCTADVLTDGELLSGELFGTDYWGQDDPENDRGSSFDKAFDGDISTFYDAYDATFDAHVGLDVGTATRLTEVHIVPRNSGSYDPAVTVIDGSGGFVDEEIGLYECHDTLFDRTLDTVWCQEVTGNDFVIWQTERPMEIVGYELYTGYDTGEFPSRNPTAWTLYGSVDGETWEVIDEQSENYDLPAENKAMYDIYFTEEELDENGDPVYDENGDPVYVDKYMPAYSWFKLTIDAVEDDTFQLGEIRLMETSDEYNRMPGMTVQGSADGIRWTDLYTFPGEQVYYAQPYVITADDMDYVNDYSFTQFRVLNSKQHFNVAEVEFYGVDGSELEAYPDAIAGEHKLNDEAELFGSNAYEEGSEYDKAFDGDVTTFYDAAEDVYQEIGITLDNPAQLTGIRVLPRIDSGLPIPHIEALDGTEGYENENYHHIFDYNYDTKWCAPAGDGVYVVWEMPESVAIDGYRFITANDTAEYPGRNPAAWTLYGSQDGSDWHVIDETSGNYDIPAEDCAEYTVELAERADSYSYYKLEISGLAGDEGNVQLSEFILLYEGCTDAVPEGWGERMINLTIQGSVNGEDWITLFQFPDRGYDLTWYDIGADMLASAAHEYAFTQFRVINKTEHLNVAEVEFCGTYEHELDSFPTEIYEPIYSYLTGEQFVETYGEYDGWYFLDRDEEEMTRFEREFEGREPVALVGGAGFNETVLELSEIDGKPIFAVAPYAFAGEDGIVEVVVDENSECREILDGAFRGCEALETVTVSNSLYQVVCWAFNETPNLREFIKADENLTDEEKDERGWRFVEVYDGVLTGYGSLLLRYPQGKEYVESYELPDFVNTIDHGAFADAPIGKITMGNVQRVYNWAFAGSQAHTIELSPYLLTLGENVFSGCRNLTDLVIPSDNVWIDRWMDEDSDLTDEEFMFNPDAFTETNHEERTENLRVTAYAGSVIEEYVDYIKSLEREDYDMSHIEFVPYDGIHWLYADWDQFDEYREEGEVFLIGVSAPQDAQIGELPAYTDDGRLVSGVRGDTEWCGLCDKAYLGDENGTLVIPDSYRYVIRIPFPGCNKVTKLVLPASMEFSEFPVEGMLNLETFEIAENAEQYYVTDDGMAYYDRNGDHGYPVLAAYAVGNSRREDNPVTEFTVAEGTYEIHHSVFRDATYLTTVNLPDSLVMIDSHAFRNSGLTEITLPASVQLLLPEAFAECHDLTSVKIESLSGEFCNPEYWWDNDWHSVFADSENVTVYVYAGTRAEEAAQEYGWPYETLELEATVYDTYTANDGVHLSNVLVKPGDTYFTIPEDVQVIDDYAFAGIEGIETVVFPKNLRYVGHEAFAGCGEFEVIFSGAVPMGWEESSFDFDFGALYDEYHYCRNTFVDGILYQLTGETQEPREAMVVGYWYNAISEDGVLEVPETIQGYEGTHTVVAVAPEALQPFYGPEEARWFVEDVCGESLPEAEWTYPTSIVLPDTVRYTGDGALAGYNYWDEEAGIMVGLESVAIPKSVQFIGGQVFSNNPVLKEFTGLDAYGADSAYPYRLTEDGSVVNVWNEHIFLAYPSGSDADTYTVPDGIEVIGWAAFCDATNLVSVTIPEGVRYTENEAFAWCGNLETVSLPSTLEEIRHGSFRGCNSLTDFVLPNGNDRFFVHEDGTLRTDDGDTIAVFPLGLVPEDGVLRISDGVKGIWGAAAAGSDRLTELVLPDSIEWISDWAFEDASNLRKVTFEGTVEEDMSVNVFGWCRSLDEIVYYGDYLNMFIYSDEPGLTVGLELDEEGNILHDADGNEMTRKFNLRLANENADITFFIVNNYNWEDLDYDTYGPDNNPYFNLIRGLEEEESVPGDINGDGEVTPKDRMYIERYLANWDGYTLEGLDFDAADLNGDGEITPKDRLILARHIAGWEGYEDLAAFRS